MLSLTTVAKDANDINQDGDHKDDNDVMQYDDRVCVRARATPKKMPRPKNCHAQKIVTPKKIFFFSKKLFFDDSTKKSEANYLMKPLQ